MRPEPLESCLYLDSQNWEKFPMKTYKPTNQPETFQPSVTPGQRSTPLVKLDGQGSDRSSDADITLWGIWILAGILLLLLVLKYWGGGHI